MSEKRIVTDLEELKYRARHFHDIRAVKDRQIICASCGNQLNIESNTIFCHPLVGLLQCEICSKHFKHLDVYKNKRYCYICGDIKKLYVCSEKDCISAFCKKCIKRNVSLTLLDAERDDWKCYMCNPKPLWELRGVCSAVIGALPKRGNGKKTRKSEKFIFPSQKEKALKAKRTQKILQALCDKEEDGRSSSEEDRPSFGVIFEKTDSEDCHVNMTSTDSSNTRKSMQKKIRGNGKVQPRLSCQDSSSSSQTIISSNKLTANRKHALKKREVCSDLNESSIVLSDEVIRSKRRIKSHNKTFEKLRNRKEHVTDSSDDETEMKSSASEAESNTFGRLSRRIAQQSNRKDTSNYNMRSAKSETRKYHDSTSEPEYENVGHKKLIKRHINDNTSHINKKKREKSYKTTNKDLLSETQIQKANSDSSSQYFQKKKLFSSKRSIMKQLSNLDDDCTKSLDVSKSINNKHQRNEKNVDIEQSKFNQVKEILSECKIKCSHFERYVEAIEQLYDKEDDKEELMQKFLHKIVKLTMTLITSKKHIEILHRLSNRDRTKNSAKRPQEALSNDERSSTETSLHMERTATNESRSCETEIKHESKEVSECDSDEIFSADEIKSSRKTKTTFQDAVDNMPRSENNRAHSDDKTNNVAETSVNKSKDNTENNTDLQDDLVVSPVLGASFLDASKKKKASVDKDEQEGLAAENIDLQTKSIELDYTEIYSNETESNLMIDESATSLNDGGKLAKNKITDNSLDLFDVSFDENEEENMDMQGADVETSSKDQTNYSTRDNSNKILNEKDGKFLSRDNSEEEDNQKEVKTTNNEKVYNESNGTKKIDVSEKENVSDVEFLKTEALAKTILPKSSSDNSASLTVASVTKLTEESITDSVHAKKNKKAENDNSGVEGSNTVISRAFTDEKNSLKDTEVKAKAKDEYSHKASKANSCEVNFSDENEIIRAKINAKKALLESSNSNQDSPLCSSPVRSDKTDMKDKRYESDSTSANIKAKKALLASSSSDSDCSELSVFEITTRKENRRSIKRQHDHETDTSSTISAVKKRRLQLTKNYYYRNDRKLRMSCEVLLVRLDEKVLKRYSRALQKSREYLERKELKSLVNLDRLEKKHKKSSRIDSTDDDASLNITQKSKRGKHMNEEAEESLMDHLKKIENDDSLAVQSDHNSDELVRHIANIDSALVSNEDLILKANKAAKRNLLNSSDSDIEKVMTSDNENSANDENKQTEDRKKKTQKKSEEKTLTQCENTKEESEKSNWRKNKILTMKFSDSDSDTQKKKWDIKQEKLKEKEENNSDSDGEKCIKLKKKIRRRIIDSDSDVKLTDCSDSEDPLKMSSTEQDSNSNDMKKKRDKQKRKRRSQDKSTDSDSLIEEKKPKVKRKRIKKMSSDSDSDVVITSQGTLGKSGRKNIRKVLKDKQVAEDTKLAAKEEEERLKRIAERQSLYNEMYEMRIAGEEKVEKLVLDFDTETKEELVSIHEELVKRLKPHQAQGIKFMWDACFESLERMKVTSGSGCIIAHCMGLGKTLQVIALTHTLLTHEATNIKTVLVLCPLSTVLNWVNEYKMWLKDLEDDVEIYELTKAKKNFERKYMLQRWQKTGGVLIIGYEMFRNLTGPSKNMRKILKETMLQCLIDPGADLVICDEGHLLKNEETALSKCVRRVKTMRRVVLTGTPLQNNLTEYHCMVQFVKPNLLGTKKEFLNRFVNPITNGQFDDSTAYDVKLMKKRAHVLHKMLEGSVQRFDYSVLTPFLPPKQEYVIFVRLTDTQIKMYKYYLDNLIRRYTGGGTLFANFQALQRIWTHPIVLRLNAEKIEKANEKKELSDSEGSLRDFINDDSTDIETSSKTTTESDSDVQAIDDLKDNTNVSKRRTRNNPGEEEPEPSPKEDSEKETEWWSQFVQPEHFEDMRASAKLLLFFGILKECEQIGDKVLLFSQSLYSLTLIEEFLQKIDDATQKDISSDILDNHTGSWSLGLDYFRLDGQTSPENRSAWCRIFNKPTNTRARLFLISTRAGGLGINLTAANRVILFDASWNPSHDVQSIFRIYRFGQKKPCYVYRFLAAGTMEEKIYNRQVTKLSLSCRVVDEQQIERHYSNDNLNELYMLEPYNNERPTLNLPKDRLLAEIFLKYKDVVENYHEHDSLLENKAEEELDEEERKQAWLEYEEEKKGKPIVMMPTYQNNMLMQQSNFMMHSDQHGNMIPANMSLQMEYENLQQLIRKDFPNATPHQQKLMTNQALIEMYNYWERQAVLQPVRNPTVSNPQTRLPVPHATTNSNMHQMSQLHQLLTRPPTNYVNLNQTAPSGQVMSATSSKGASSMQVAAQSNTTNKNQEE